jgi:hypothetical protein
MMRRRQNIKFTVVRLFYEKNSRWLYKRVDLLTPR